MGGESPTQAHLEAAGDVRGPDAACRQLDDPLPLAGGEGAAIDEETPQLVHAAGPWGEPRQPGSGDRACCEGGRCLPFPPRLTGRAPGPVALRGEGLGESGTPVHWVGVWRGLGRRTWSNVGLVWGWGVGTGSVRQKQAGNRGTSPGMLADGGSSRQRQQGKAAAKGGDGLGWASRGTSSHRPGAPGGLCGAMGGSATGP